jgi:murein DD-endopeptidase MepM/ murein hydrolase activator NlpD
MAPGVVVLAQPLWFEGNTVIVYHGDNVYTTYCHLKNIRVNVNDLVSAGHLLGVIGSTGRASGVHLHLAMRIGNANVSPLQARDALNRTIR